MGSVGVGEVCFRGGSYQSYAGPGLKIVLSFHGP